MSQAELRLPEEVDGPWEHAVLLSFGLNLPFFEKALARQLPPTCRNRSCSATSEHTSPRRRICRANLVHSAGRAYVAGPILLRDDDLLTSVAAWHLDRVLDETGWLYLHARQPP